jgi:photosystem II stability/assembly factor-like uncharacterized protein
VYLFTIVLFVVIYYTNNKNNRMTSYCLAPNVQQGGIYRGECYVFDTSGGFIIDQILSPIPLAPSIPLMKYDVTNAIQLTFDVRTFNTRIGIIKDASNTHTIRATLDSEGCNLAVDSVTISTTDFIQGLSVGSVISMGSMATLYSDFNKTVKTYFGIPEGFASLFACVDNFSINGGVFDATAFINLLNGNTFNSAGSLISDLSGYFTVNDVNKHLKFVCNTNVFSNRPLNTYSLRDGFLEGDLLFIPNGLNVRLSIDIEAEPVGAPTNIGPLHLDASFGTFNYSYPQVNVYKTTSSTVTNITQNYEVPILIILKNEAPDNTALFGQHWGLIYNHSLNWLAVSMSSNGQYQSAITDSGDIYVSGDYANTWTVKHNIGAAQSNCISISQTGQYQTASNGEHIYVSSNYGQTWAITYSMGRSNIFLCISLTGQYQTVVSCGDTVYTSNNYGITWTAITDYELEIYNSVETFPTAGLAISYNGQYQTIVSEHIYISRDYGDTWTKSNLQNDDVFDDRNWEGVAMSSTGQYQTAIDSGGEIYISSDYGTNWAYVSQSAVIDKLWQAVCMTATGQFQVVIEKQGSAYVSTDYGQTWSRSTEIIIDGRNWQSIAMSANGLYMTIVEYGGGIYASNLPSLGTNYPVRPPSFQPTRPPPHVPPSLMPVPPPPNNHHSHHSSRDSSRHSSRDSSRHSSRHSSRRSSPGSHRSSRR